MKFRGKITEVMAIRRFYDIVVTMAKLAKTCVLRLNHDKFYFILTEVGSHSGGPSVWCEMAQTHFFNEYNLDGVTEEDNEIYLELEPDKLAKSLSSLKSSSAKSLKIKLTRKHESPCLSFEIEMASLAANTRVCVHDIPVNLIPRRLWKDFSEPDMQEFDVSVYLPDLKKLKHLTERYKNLGHFVTVKANRRGKLKFLLESDTVTLGTHYRDLEHPKFDQTFGSKQSDNLTAEEFASVKVDLKKLNLFLNAEQVGPRRAIANLVGDRMVHLFFVHDDVYMQFFIPAILD